MSGLFSYHELEVDPPDVLLHLRLLAKLLPADDTLKRPATRSAIFPFLWLAATTPHRSRRVVDDVRNICQSFANLSSFFGSFRSRHFESRGWVGVEQNLDLRKDRGLDGRRWDRRFVGREQRLLEGRGRGLVARGRMLNGGRGRGLVAREQRLLEGRVAGLVASEQRLLEGRGRGLVARE